jgi:hypothetical protein
MNLGENTFMEFFAILAIQGWHRAIRGLPHL